MNLREPDSEPDPRLPPDRAAGQRRLRRGLEVRGPRRLHQGHQVRLRQPQLPRRRRRPRRAGAAAPSSASRRSATPSSCRWTASRSSRASWSSSWSWPTRACTTCSSSARRPAWSASRATTCSRYLRDAAEALDYMNEKHNLQHLDVKPRNLFLVSRPRQGRRLRPGQAPGAVQRLGRHGRRHAAVRRRRRRSAARSASTATSTASPSSTRNCSPASGRSTARTSASSPSSTCRRSRTCARCPRRSGPSSAGAWRRTRPSASPTAWPSSAALYTAARSRVAARVGGLRAAASATTGPRRIADTMEDILLERATSSDASVDPGGRRRRRQPGARIEVSKLWASPSPSRRPAPCGRRWSSASAASAAGPCWSLRCRFLDRFGDLNKLPLLRFLYIDCRPRRRSRRPCAARRRSPCSRTRSTTCRCSRSRNYRRRHARPAQRLAAAREALRHAALAADAGHRGRWAGWRSPTTTCGCSARLQARDLQDVTHPDALYQSVSQTGLALRDNAPRVYVIGGGRRRRQRLARRPGLRRAPAAAAAATARGAGRRPVLSAAPRTTRPRRRRELANIYATLTELNHFADPAIPFAAQYGADGPRLDRSTGSPFDSVYLLPHAEPLARSAGATACRTWAATCSTN